MKNVYGSFMAYIIILTVLFLVLRFVIYQNPMNISDLLSAFGGFTLGWFGTEWVRKTWKLGIYSE